MYQSKKPYLYGTGRRKSSVARVHVYPNGTGSITINGRDVEEYFGLDTLKMIVRQPLVATATEGKVDIVATVKGGGVMVTRLKADNRRATEHVFNAYLVYNAIFKAIFFA